MTMDSELYRDITDFAHGAPGWLRSAADIFTAAGILLLMAVAVVGWWRSRRGDARGVASALLVPCATALAYALSEIFKSLIQEDRPCRAVADAVKSVAPCPPHGDWSFPSNHSVIAGALAIGILLAWPRAGWLSIPVALLVGYSRVFLGVHYPHDVLAGLGLGALVAALCAGLLLGPATTLVERLRTGPLRPLVAA